MSTAPVSIDFPKADVRALFAQMDRAQREFGMGLPRVTKWGAWQVAQSLGAATQTPERDVVKSSKRRTVEAVKGSASAKGNKQFQVVSHRKGVRNTFSVWAKSKREANQLPQAKIGNWGLAKASWMWGVKKLGSGAKFGFATPGARSNAARNVEITMSMRRDDPWVRIVNRLPYIIEAMRGREMAISAAMGKASRAMAHTIDGKLKKQMGAK